MTEKTFSLTRNTKHEQNYRKSVSFLSWIFEKCQGSQCYK